jgi:trk system potassium uptake protein TrkH
MGAGLSAALGAVLWVVGRSAVTDFINRRDALLLVALGWIVGAALAAVPYYAWAQLGGPPSPTAAAVMRHALDPSTDLTEPPGHAFEHFIACYFESMSGLTTTGATVLAGSPYDIEALPQGLLLWRATTHWLGGLGIVVLFVAVLPVVGIGGKKIFRVEAAGPKQPGVRPRIKETARVLWLIYLTLTITQFTAYRLAGMESFDAVCHTFATLATGGFSTQNASLGQYHTTQMIDWITIAFMVLAGINFGLYYLVVNRKLTNVFRDPELRLYLSIIGVVTVVIALWTVGKTSVITTGQTYEPGLVDATRDAMFQTVSILTTTGYATIDFNQWEFLPKALLVGLMFVGGCAGSTGGGCKVIRFLIAFKVIKAEFERVFRPQAVRPIRIGPGTIDPDAARSVLVYLLLIFFLFASGAVLLKLLEPAGSLDFISAATASLACLMNIGPGLGLVGAVENFSFFSPPSLLLLSVLMALGRLEVFAILVLLLPGFWSER